MHSLFSPQLIEAILLAPPDAGDRVIGHSRAGRPIYGWQGGQGTHRVSLIGGCHADEPVGPRLLRHLVGWLRTAPADHPLLTDFSWWIVPHVNPDGEARNRRWYSDDDAHYDVARYAQHVRRELPGEDVEFGFPVVEAYAALRPENQAVYDFWRTADGPFHLHASLHGMALAYGPWFLIEPAWADRAAPLMAACRAQTAALGYALHDAERYGEKGFRRLAPGFCTRPDAGAMRRHFLDRNKPDTAALFHPSSMESMRSLGGDCLTLVSEMPLFIVPRTEPDLRWPDPTFVYWKDQLPRWQKALEAGEQTAEAVRAQAAATGLRPMSVTDQMRLQWTFVAAGLDLVGA